MSAEQRRGSLDSDNLENSNMMDSADVTGKLTTAFGTMEGKIVSLKMALRLSQETCREAEAMNKLRLDEILQLQKKNEHVTQQLLAEFGCRDETKIKVDNVHSVCVVLADHCETIRTTTSGIGMLEANLRTRQAELQVKIDQLGTKFSTVVSNTKSKIDYLEELRRKEDERCMQEIIDANVRITTSEFELSNVARQLEKEQAAQTQNIQLLNKRENTIKELEQCHVQQANNFESRICNASSALTAANAEISSLKQALMDHKLAEKDYQWKIAILEKDNCGMKDEILTTERKVQKSEHAIEILVNKKNELLLALESSECELVKYRDEQVTLTKRLGAAHNCIESLNNDHAGISNQLLAALKSFSDLEQVHSEVLVKLLAANNAFTSEQIKMMNELQQANSLISLSTEEENQTMCNLHSVKETFEQEKDALQKTESGVEFFKKNADEVTNKLSAAQQLIENLQTDKNEILQQLQGMGDSAKIVEVEKNKIYKKLLLVETTLKSMMLEKKEILDQLDCAKSTMANMELAKDEVLVKLVETEGVVNSLNAHKDRMAHDLNDAKTSIGVLEEAIREAHQKVVLSEERYNTLFIEKQQVTKDLLEAGNSIEKLEIDKSLLNEQLSSALAKSNALEMENADLIQQLKSADIKIHMLDLKIIEDDISTPKSFLPSPKEVQSPMVETVLPHASKKRVVTESKTETDTDDSVVMRRQSSRQVAMSAAKKICNTPEERASPSSNTATSKGVSKRAKKDESGK